MALKNSVKYIEQETGYDIMHFQEIKFVATVNGKDYMPYEFVKQENGKFYQIETAPDKPHTAKTDLKSKNIHSRIRYLCADGLHIHKCEITEFTTLQGDTVQFLTVYFK
jgi:hypothetical protein